MKRRRPNTLTLRDRACHDLKHGHGASREILDEFLAARGNARLTRGVRERLEAAISYFQNNLDRMNYASYRKGHLPIGSGIATRLPKSSNS